MAATKSQGKAFSLFMVGLTTACAGIAYLSSGSGMAALIVGLIVVAVSFGLFLSMKPAGGQGACQCSADSSEAGWHCGRTRRLADRARSECT